MECSVAARKRRVKSVWMERKMRRAHSTREACEVVESAVGCS
jgi:hypothetical protein